MVIGCDIDGVLADFNASYRTLIREQTGIDLPEVPPTWHYDTAAGVTKAQQDAAWAVIKASRFWLNLPALPGALATLRRLKALATRQDDAVYFITARPGVRAKTYTEWWLEENGYPHPTVLIAYNKGPLAESLALDVFIDDRWENVVDVKNVRGDACEVYLVDRAYNRIYQNDEKDIHRVSSALEALQRIDEQSFDRAA